MLLIGLSQCANMPIRKYANRVKCAIGTLAYYHIGTFNSQFSTFHSQFLNASIASVGRPPLSNAPKV